MPTTASTSRHCSATTVSLIPAMAATLPTSSSSCVSDLSHRLPSLSQFYVSKFNQEWGRPWTEEGKATIEKSAYLPFPSLIFSDCRLIMQIQPGQFCAQVQDTSTHSARKQRLPSPRDRRHRRVPRFAAVSLLTRRHERTAQHSCSRLGIPSRLVIFPDENHWVLNHGNRSVYNAFPAAKFEH